MFVSWRFYDIKKRRVHSYCSVHNASLHNTCKHDVILDIRIFHSFLFVLYLCLPYFIFSLPSFLVHISNLLCSGFRSSNSLQNYSLFIVLLLCIVEAIIFSTTFFIFEIDQNLCLSFSLHRPLWKSEIKCFFFV